MSTRSTQTNEVARSGAFLPLLARLPQPLALIEVGASAGLCLFPDRYGYSYNGRRIGNSKLQISVSCSGGVPVPDHMPRIAWRRGIDLNPLDVRRPEDLAWLRACIWPEHEARRDRLDIAAAIAAEEAPTILEGDLLLEIERTLDECPSGVTKVVFHSAVLNYVNEDDRCDFAELMIGREDVTWLSNEAPGIVPGLAVPTPVPDGAHFVLGENGKTVAAFTDPHGAWLSWLRR